MTGEKQHDDPCGECPFTNRVEPGFLGGSPAEVYVAQHFMPFKVGCHARADYKGPEEDWEETVLDVEDCVGFAMCRNGHGADKILPDGAYKSGYRPEVGAFKDIWDFWAFHQGVSRYTALAALSPTVIARLLWDELGRSGLKLWNEEEDVDPEKAKGNMMAIAMDSVASCYQRAFREHHQEGAEDGVSTDQVEVAAPEDDV